MARSTTTSTRTPNLPAIAGISYVFPERSRSVRQMADDGLLESSAETMESFGLRTCMWRWPRAHMSLLSRLGANG